MNDLPKDWSLLHKASYWALVGLMLIPAIPLAFLIFQGLIGGLLFGWVGY